MTIDDNWIAEQEAICAKATEGPWQNYYNRRKVFRSANPYPDTNSLQVVGEMERFADGDFAASARTALPLALAELWRLREIVGKLPVTADGVPVVPCQAVWSNVNGDGLPLKAPERLIAEGLGMRNINKQAERGMFMSGRAWFSVANCYSTEKAALAARERGE